MKPNLNQPGITRNNTPVWALGPNFQINVVFFKFNLFPVWESPSHPSPLFAFLGFSFRTSRSPHSQFKLEIRRLGITQPIIKNQGLTIKQWWSSIRWLRPLILTNGRSQPHPLMFMIGWAPLSCTSTRFLPIRSQFFTVHFASFFCKH